MLQIQQFICEFGEAGESLGDLTPLNYNSEVKSIETLAEGLADFAENFETSEFASDEELSKIVKKLNVGGQGMLLLMEMNREYISEYNASAFTIISPIMRTYLSNSEDVFRSTCEQIRNMELPSKYDDWY